MNMMLRFANTIPLRIATALLAALPACSLSPDLPKQSPALADMEEPLNLRTEPNDEAERQKLPFGTFSGLYLRDARDTLAAKLDEPTSLEVGRVVENSPADRAGLLAGDIVLEVQIADSDPKVLARPSEWRKIELTGKPGDKVALFVDRAGREAETELTLTARLHPAERDLAERYREEQRVGIVVRTATEVEARAANLGPGAGAVLVGMSARSPWRTAGLQFEDVIVALDEQELAHPQDLLAFVRNAERQTVDITYMRNGQRQTVAAGLTNRDSELSEITLPLLFSYEADRGRSEWSFLLGMLNYRSTAAAWRFRLLWLIGFGGGDADLLLEQGS